MAMLSARTRKFGRFNEHVRHASLALLGQPHISMAAICQLRQVHYLAPLLWCPWKEGNAVPVTASTGSLG